MAVPFYKPSLPDYELVEKDFRDAYERGFLAPGKYTERFALAAREYLNVEYAIPFSNCSDALMCLVGYIKDMTNRKYIIIPDFTFAATWQAVDWNGMTALICDVDEHGLMDVGHLEYLLSLYHREEIAGVLAVHMFGQPAWVSELEELSIKYRVPVIYDAAHGFGSLYEGETLGNWGLAEVFSFGTTKPLSAGEGGLITTDNHHLAAVMQKAAMHGHKVGELDVECKSLNGRIQEINSIIAYHGLANLEQNMRRRQQLASKYNVAFKENDYVKPLAVRPGCRSSYKDYTITCMYRDALRLFLDKKGVQTKIYYAPEIRNLNDFRGAVATTRSWKSSYLVLNCLSLPFFTDMTEEQQDEVINVIEEFYVHA